MEFREILDDFVSLIYPKFCYGCQGSLVKGEEIICTHCLLDLPRTNYHLNADNPLAIKFHGRLDLSHALAYLKFRKKSKVQNLLHALKYKGCRDVGYKLGLMYGEELKRIGISEQYDVITSVPLHINRFRQRGYNQSDEWAKGISESTKVLFKSNLLIRKTRTTTQTKRSKLGRWENVSEVFELKSQGSVVGARILLVDDVVTTGATIESCGKLLLAESCKSLGIACLAVSQ